MQDWLHQSSFVFEVLHAAIDTIRGRQEFFSAMPSLPMPWCARLLHAASFDRAILQRELKIGVAKMGDPDACANALFLSLEHGQQASHCRQTGSLAYILACFIM